MKVGFKRTWTTMKLCRRVCCSVTLFYLFNLVQFVWSNSCSNPPECELGHPAKCKPCPPKKYFDLKMQKFAFCTQHCSAERHLTQVKDCTDYSNRECHCDRGFYCDDPIQFTCRRCQPCRNGFFFNITSRARSCLLHTNCTSLGMAVISKGNRTHNQVCGNITPGPKPGDLLLSKTITQTATHSHATRTLTNPGFVNSELSLSASTSVNNKEYRASQSSWLLVMLLVVLAAVVLLVGFAKLHKKLALRRTFKMKGLPFLKNGTKGEQLCLRQDCVAPETVQQLASSGGSGPRALVSDEEGGLVPEGAEQSPGCVQHISVDQTGGKENVNNTVGSIFIYSPGMVILGANASEQKGETEERQEDGDKAKESWALVSTPQQESQEEVGGPGSRNGVLEGSPVRGGVQEAERKELCYPIPATGK